MTDPWLYVVGIGADGIDGLPPAARAVIDSAEILIGGERHLAMLPDDGRPRYAWPAPMTPLLDALPEWRGRRVCVLATGEPLWHGVASTLARRIDPAEIVVLPHIGAFSLTCARLVWPLADVEAISLHGRAVENLHAYLHPGARVVALSRDGDTPAQVARLLRASGYASSRMSVFEQLGGPAERRTDGSPAEIEAMTFDNLNTVAIACVAEPGVPLHPRVPGLPDAAFRHDGQLTKGQVRAATLAALQPIPGQLLWDIGAGSGSVGIEWLRSDRRCRAVAVEKRADRRALAAENAMALGCPHLEIVEGEAPDVLARLDAPDAVFVGGGLTYPNMLPTCWAVLKPGGRLVANAVTLEGESRLAEWYAKHGGSLVRIHVSEAEPLGAFTGWRPHMPVTQYAAVKS
jgi:precorrin-6Y C5,15-methyltransferase (decarboxylating)